MRESAAGSDGRAQTETLGFVLVFGIVLLGALVVVGFGLTTVNETQDRLSEDRAENILTEFDSKAALVALGESNTHRISFASAATEQFTLDEEDGWMNVTSMNRSTENHRAIMNVTLGSIVYESDDARLAYQGGGVWRVDERGGQMISPPEFHYRGATLTLPTVTLSGDPILSGTNLVRHERTTAMFPTDSRPNPLENHIVTVTVGSEYYRGWGEYFEERTAGDVEYDHDAKEVELTLTSPIGEIFVEGALAGQNSGGTLNFQANPGHPCHKGGNPKPPYFDSYNSSDPGNYCDQYDEDEVNPAGDIIFGGDITTQAAAGQIQGDLVSGGSVELFHQQDLHGNVSYVDSCNGCATAQEPGYSIVKGEKVDVDPAIDFVIENTLAALRLNLAPTDVGDEGTLEAGSYYTEAVDLSGEDVVFDTRDGDITLAVNGTVSIDSGSNVSILGDNDVNVYVGGSDTADDFRVAGGAEIFAPGNDATLLTVLGTGDFDATIDGGEMSGVIYAPTGTEGTGETTIVGGGTVYGGIVTGDLTIGNPRGGTVHFDRALIGQQIVPPNRSIVRLTYLHVTENEISIRNV